jgi:hypothetical protein
MIFLEILGTKYTFSSSIISPPGKYNSILPTVTAVTCALFPTESCTSLLRSFFLFFSAYIFEQI